MFPRRLEQRVLRAVNQANREFGMIAGGDRVLVALSGGKDSYGLLWALQQLRAAAPFDFELVAYHLDQGQPGHDTAPIEAHMRAAGVPYEIEVQDTYTRVVEKTAPGKIYCSLCSRFRRAILYKAAVRQGCNKVALGHHRDDLIETLLLSMLYAGQIKSMAARLRSANGGQEVIRPLCYVPEEELVELAELHAFAIVPCRLCGSQVKERAFVKDLLGQLSARSPHIKGNLMRSLANVLPSHLLDQRLNPDALGDVQGDLELTAPAPTAAAAPTPAPTPAAAPGPAPAPTAAAVPGIALAVPAAPAATASAD